MTTRTPEAKSLREALGAFLTGTEPARIGEGYIHASSVHGLCTRQEAIARAAGTPLFDVVTPRDRVRWDQGKAIADWFRDHYLGPMGRLYGEWRCLGCGNVLTGLMPQQCAQCGGPFTYQERELREETCKIRGSLDGIDRDPNPALGFGVLELKTIDGRLYGMLKAPMPGHVMQAQIYMWLGGYAWGRIAYIPMKLVERGIPLKEFFLRFDVRVPELVRRKVREIERGGTRACKTPREARALICPHREPCWRTTS